MAFPIYLHDLKPAIDGRESRARHAARHEDVGVSDERPSIWKRELSFGRRKQQPESEGTADVDATFDETQEPVDEAAVAQPEPEPEAEPEDERRSLWKREVSFGRKRGQDDEPSAESEPPFEETVFDDNEPLAEAESQNERRSIWKRELSFGRKREQQEDEAQLDAQPSFEEQEESAQVDEPATEPEPEADPWPAPVELPRTDEPAPLPAAETWSFEPDPEPEVDSWSAPVEPAPFDEPAPLPVAETWSFEPDPEPEVDSWSAPLEPAPIDEPAPLPVAETWTLEPEPEDSSEAEEPVEHESEPETTKPSIWKREMSFGRKRRQHDEAAFDVEPPQHDLAQDAPVVEPEPEADPEPETSPVSNGERPSIWKRDLSFGRQKRDWEFEDSAEHDTEVAPAEPAFQPEPVADAWPATLNEEPVDEPMPVPVAASFAPDPDVAHDIELESPFEATTDSFEPADDEAPTESKKKRKKSTATRADKRAARGSKGGKKLVGLKVGASQIAAAVVQTNGTHEVLKLARTSLDRGVVVAGEVRDPDALAAALRTFFSDNKLPKRDVRLGIASNRVGVRVLDVSGVEDPKLLGNAVRFRAQEVLPIPLSEAVLDYRVLRERTEEDGTVTHEVLVAFAYRELVDRYASVCRLAGLRLVGIDLDGFALLRALVDPNVADGRLGGAAVVTVALGHDRSIMSVSDGAVCEFTRVIEWGGGSLDTAVARILALTPSQAEPIKRQLTLDRRTAAPEGLSPDQAGRARAAMVQEVHAFAREFVSSLQFYQAQPRSLDIGEIVVTGGTAHMPGLVEQLHELIGVSVRIGDPLARVTLGKNVSTDEQVGSLALAIGLGIED